MSAGGYAALLAELSRRVERGVGRPAPAAPAGERRLYVVPGPERAVVYQRPDGSRRLVLP